jgi:hypothetical protein
MEGHTLSTLEQMMKNADSFVVIVEEGQSLKLGFSHHLTQMEVLDMLAFVTSIVYETASEDEPPIIH